MAGYSATPLVRKLGFKEGFRAALVNAPTDFTRELEGLPAGVEFVASRARELDLILLFVESRRELYKTFDQLAARLAPAGMLWVAWRKKSSGAQTGLDENVVRETGLEAGLVDTKVCAINETWSGLRFVRWLRDRATK
jgi:enoyl-CoA hydratase/carnithine racemase